MEDVKKLFFADVKYRVLYNAVKTQEPVQKQQRKHLPDNKMSAKRRVDPSFAEMSEKLFLHRSLRL